MYIIIGKLIAKNGTQCWQTNIGKTYGKLILVTIIVDISTVVKTIGKTYWQSYVWQKYVFFYW